MRKWLEDKLFFLILNQPNIFFLFFFLDFIIFENVDTIYLS